MNARKAVRRTGFICIKVAVFILICLGLVYLGQTTYQYTHAVFREAAMEEEPGRNVKITIPENVSAKKFAEVLEENGLIENALVFQMQMKIESFGETVKAGTYELNTSMKPGEIFKILSEANEDES